MGMFETIIGALLMFTFGAILGAACIAFWGWMGYLLYLLIKWCITTWC